MKLSYIKLQQWMQILFKVLSPFSAAVNVLYNLRLQRDKNQKH